MTSIYNDKEYVYIVNDILKNEEFNQLKEFEHHGVTRYEHSLKVSYVAYKLSKFLKLDTHTAARGGLLHDFFVSQNERTLKERTISLITHPVKAANNAKRVFNVSAKEENIIESHMFFTNPKRVPKYMESWLVILADTLIGGYELGYKAKDTAVNYASLLVLFILNYSH